MSSLYKAVYTPRQALVLEHMSKKISEGTGFGITLQGNRVTLRWTMPGEKDLVEVHMIVESTRDPRDFEELEDAEYAEKVHQ